jgi:hypothetical protein
MVITGDRDAPLVLHIVPWQEPAPVELPKAPRQRLVPVVVDRLRNILEEPVNRPIGQSAKVTR